MSANALTVDEDPRDPGDQDTSALRRLSRWAFRSSAVWIFGVLLLEIALFSVVLPYDTFLSSFNAKTILSDSAVLLILAAAATLVITAGGLDLSIGSLMALSAVVAGRVMTNIAGAEGLDNQTFAILAGLGAGVGVALVWGVINGLLIALVKVPPFIVTLGSLGAALGVARLLSGGVAVGGGPQALQENFGQADALGIPVPFWIGAAAALACGLLLAKSRFGEHNYLIGSNEEAARRGGINVTRHVILLYALSGLLAGLAGVVDLARFDVASVSTGHVTELIAAIAAVVIGGASLFGGVGGMVGTVVGVYIPVVLANGLLIGGIERFWQDVIIGIILVAAVAFDEWRRGQEARTG